MNNYSDGAASTELRVRVEALTGLTARQAQAVVDELEAEGHYSTVTRRPTVPPDHLIIRKAKELGFLPDDWRLP